MDECHLFKLADIAKKPEPYKRLDYYIQKNSGEEIVAFKCATPKVYSRNGMYLIRSYEICEHFDIFECGIVKKRKFKSLLESGRIVQVNGSVYAAKGRALSTKELIGLGYEPKFSDRQKITHYKALIKEKGVPLTQMFFDLKKLPEFYDVSDMRSYMHEKYGIWVGSFEIKENYLTILSWDFSFGRYDTMCYLGKRGKCRFHKMYSRRNLKKFIAALSVKMTATKFKSVRYGIESGGIELKNDREMLLRAASFGEIGVLPDGTLTITPDDIINKKRDGYYTSSKYNVPFARYSIKLSKERRVHVIPINEVKVEEFTEDAPGVFPLNSDEDMYYLYGDLDERYPETTYEKKKLYWRAANVEDYREKSVPILKCCRDSVSSHILSKKTMLLDVLEKYKEYGTFLIELNNLVPVKEFSSLPKSIFLDAIRERWPERIISIDWHDENIELFFEPPSLEYSELKKALIVKSACKILDIFDESDLICMLVEGN